MVWAKLRKLFRRKAERHIHSFKVAEEKVIAKCERCGEPTSFTYLKCCGCGSKETISRYFGWLVRGFPSAPRRSKEDYLCSNCFRERIAATASRIGKVAEVQGIPFAEEHEMPYGYSERYKGSFDWEALRRLGLVKMRDIDEEGLKRLLMREDVILVATHSEEHYRFYTLWLMVRCHRVGAYMVCVLDGDYMH